MSWPPPLQATKYSKGFTRIKHNLLSVTAKARPNDGFIIKEKVNTSARFKFLKLSWKKKSQAQRTSKVNLKVDKASYNSQEVPNRLLRHCKWKVGNAKRAINFMLVVVYQLNLVFWRSCRKWNPLVVSNVRKEKGK